MVICFQTLLSFSTCAAKPGQTLFVTFATKSVEDFVVTWLESAARLGGALQLEISRTPC